MSLTTIVFVTNLIIKIEMTKYSRIFFTDDFFYIGIVLIVHRY